jgi:hypothetical protein
LCRRPFCRLQCFEDFLGGFGITHFEPQKITRSLQAGPLRPPYRDQPIILS